MAAIKPDFTRYGLAARLATSNSVLFDGKLLVERSKDPEHDATRALVAKGISGKLTMLDGKTGIPRTIIDN
jgi:hypothetical protein